ncbi:MAG: cohesin domain-containing protein [Euryarchaeota archaeon]|nr:cohesin domain-containing protein [Euryarchaeota archaeon]
MKQKERMTICMISMLVLICGAVLAASAAQISVMPTSQTVSKGDNFTIDIYVDPEGNVTAGVDYILSFDNTLVNATSLASGDFFDGFTTDDTYGKGINNTLGTVDYGEMIWPYTGTGVTDPGIVTTITFQAIAEEAGVSELYFETATLCDPLGVRISTTHNDGNVSVIAGIPGDVDGLEGITTNDGRQIFMYLLHGADAYPLQDLWAADCDGLCDGITTNDGRQIFMHLLHGADAYPLVCC